MDIYPWLQHSYLSLVSRAEQHKLHHALLLFAKNGVGKTDFALRLAQYLLCKQTLQHAACGQCKACTLFNAGSHPDLHQIESEKQIGVDQIREGLAKLSVTAQLSGAKVLIIHAADTMTEASANALLKTLEEPTANTFLLLTAESKHKLLPTVLSRCEKIRLSESDARQTLDWLNGQGVDIPPALLELYADRPLLALQKCQQVAQGKSYIEFQQILDKLTEQDPVQVASEWQENAEEVVAWLQYWLQQKTVQAMNSQSWQLYQACQSARQSMLNPGINKVLLLSQLFSQTQQLLTKSV